MAFDTRSSSRDFEDTKAPIGGDPDVVPITEDDLYIDPVKEKRLVRKLDMHVAPVVSDDMWPPAMTMKLSLLADILFRWLLYSCLHILVCVPSHRRQRTVSVVGLISSWANMRQIDPTLATLPARASLKMQA